jgi:predicted XRE-type DNA-binding protein
MHEEIIPSSGNVFADLGFPHPEEELAKSQLAYRLATIIEKRNLSLKEAAHLLGSHAQISRSAKLSRTSCHEGRTVRSDQVI